MARYHIAEDGTPGVCKAKSVESCPKTQAGDGFHGTLEEAQVESERRFAKEFGDIPTNSKGNAPATREAALAARKKEVQDSLNRFQDPSTSEAERKGIEEWWRKQKIDSPYSAMSRFQALEFQEGRKDRPRVDKASSSQIFGALSHASPYSQENKTMGQRIADGAEKKIESTDLDNSHAELAMNLQTFASEADRDYIVNDVSERDLHLFEGQRKGFGKGDFAGLVKVHKSMVERYGQGSPHTNITNQLPEDVRNQYREDGNRDGIGSLRPWGQPSNSIQNLRDDTARMLAQHVVDSYGPENAEKFWSQAAASTGNNRATLANVFKTMRKFDRERGIRG